MDLKAIQAALKERKFDAWLFYDHHHRDPIAYRVLGLSEKLHVTRRWYYLIPAEGEPKKLVHRIESFHLDSLPGAKTAYSSWKEQQGSLQTMLAPYANIAMQYSHNNLVPVIGLVDAGTIELIRSFGKNIISSGDLVSLFEAALTDAQIATHYAARDKVDPIMAGAFQFIRQRLDNGTCNEYEAQQFVMQAFEREGLITDSPIIVGCNGNAGNPHYGPSRENNAPIKNGDFVLIDMWAKLNDPDAVYYDITWTGVCGTPTARHQEIFNIVTKARDAGLQMAATAISSGRKICGWEIDDATRKVIADAGYGEYFTHRTGHSIGTEIHANGANIDNLETQDDRAIIPNTCFSIEPGIYLPEFGVRSEFDVMVAGGKAVATGRVQTELVKI
jgi:Xaa-Pro dipeptidase